MSTTAHYEPVRPIEPLGSCYTLKRLLFDDFNQGIGAEQVVVHGTASERYLEGYRDALPPSDAKTDLAEFLEALAKHGQLRVWIDE